MTHANAALVERFYDAFSTRDYAGMIACYHPDVTFSDPVFTDLHGWKAGAMWRMLCTRGKDLTLTFGDITADDETGSAHWEADYTFSTTGKQVHNVIDATFRFSDSLIIAHTDAFDLWRWTRMALGVKGVLLGWLPPVQGAIRKQALGGLTQFIDKHGLSAENVAG